MNQRSWRRNTALCTAFIMGLLLISCAPKQAPDAADDGEIGAQQTEAAMDSAVEWPITIVDMAGRTVTLERPATRIITLAAGDCEILYAIGAGDTLVGRGEYCNYPPEASATPGVQTGSETNIEQILALDPEVVVLNTMAQTLEQVEALEKAGVVTVASRAEDVAGAYRAIEMLGVLTDHSAEAEALIHQMQGTFANLTAQAEALQQGSGTKTVYFEVSPLAYGLWTAGSGTFMNEIASMLGLANAFADVTGWAEISQEQVIARNPDYIVTIAMYFGEGPTPEQEILARAGWQEMAAVKNGAVFAADSDAMARPGPRLADAAQALFDFVSAQSGRETLDQAA